MGIVQDGGVGDFGVGWNQVSSATSSPNLYGTLDLVSRRKFCFPLILEVNFLQMEYSSGKGYLTPSSHYR